jgi:hypothetical protein
MGIETHDTQLGKLMLMVPAQVLPTSSQSEITSDIWPGKQLRVSPRADTLPEARSARLPANDYRSTYNGNTPNGDRG